MFQYANSLWGGLRNHQLRPTGASFSLKLPRVHRDHDSRLWLGLITPLCCSLRLYIYHIQIHYQSPGFEPVSLVVFPVVYGRASSVLEYNIILKHTQHSTLDSLLLLGACFNVFQYNFLLRFLSQDCGLLSPCNKIVLGVVLAKKLHYKFLKNLVATDSIVCCYVSIITPFRLIVKNFLCLLALSYRFRELVQSI